jgi:dihydroorotate dehydrogenase electron transfer subunit
VSGRAQQAIREGGGGEEAAIAARVRAQPESGDRVLAPFGRRLLRVTRNESLGAYRLLWALDEGGPISAPGQFAMIAAAERWGGGADERPYLPRAFSIARVSGQGESAFLVEDVGPGTARLAELTAGEGLWLLGPLGHGFSAAPAGVRTILVGGGVGIAPLAILQDAIAAEGSLRESVTLLGFRDSAHAEGAALLRDPRVATDDGSVGEPGFVTELLERELDKTPPAPPAVVRACGPPAMLEAVRAICERREVPAELALESGMACGFGACYGCVVPRRGGGYLRVCLDGPVVDAAQLERVA